MLIANKHKIKSKIQLTFLLCKIYRSVYRCYCIITCAVVATYHIGSLESSAQSTSSSEDDGDQSDVGDEEQNTVGDVTNMTVVISQLVEKGIHIYVYFKYRQGFFVHFKQA